MKTHTRKAIKLTRRALFIRSFFEKKIFFFFWFSGCAFSLFCCGCDYTYLWIRPATISVISFYTFPSSCYLNLIFSCIMAVCGRRYKYVEPFQCTHTKHNILTRNVQLCLVMCAAIACPTVNKKQIVAGENIIKCAKYTGPEMFFFLG
jgi:hypothetical protein